ncbi:TRAP transporter small permease [Paracoccus onubensis]|uniref:TRAP transporter small permease protein n=1 Tax=Paracoccus onubensis TaxID=1675788 RepID=A0A418SNM6_9RHOB|nr:TRAP transporter small permease [Paracoccus onubensis]RJE82512.1 TRAP transporter small permease [Paracoccus onubensis]
MADTEIFSEAASPISLPGWLLAACKGFAAIGGVTLLAMMLMTVASVVLRGIIGKPIPGDFELVELGSAITIFCFLPWCQATGGNVVVDFFTQKARPRAMHLMDAFGSLLYLLIAGLLLWRLIHGALEMRQYGEQTMVLAVQVWWSFIIILPAMALLTVTCAASFLAHLKGVRA